MQRGVDCLRQDYWAKIELCLIKKILENTFNYCGLQIGTEWNIEKAAKKSLNKF